MSEDTIIRRPGDDVVAVIRDDRGVVSIHDADTSVTLSREQAAWLFRSAGPVVLYEIDRPPLRKAPGSG